MTTSSFHLANQMLVGEILKRSAYRSPNRKAFVYEGQSYTYSEMENRASHIAGWLQSIGINHNDKVGLLLKNSLVFVEAFFGIALSGAVSVPMNIRLSAAEIQYIINNSDAKILIVDQEFKGLISEIRAQLPQIESIVVVNSAQEVPDSLKYEDIFNQPASYISCEKLCDDDGCVILYTSGTTGRPKGAWITHKNLFSNGMNTIWEVAYKRHAHQMIVTPLFHLSAIVGMLNVCFIEGTCFILQKFDPELVLQTISVEKINATTLVPTMWIALLQVPTIQEYDLSSMEVCVTVGAVCPSEIKRAIMKHFTNAGFYDGFGSTEMSTASYLQPEDSFRKTNSVGKPIINLEIRIVDDHMNDVPVGEVGEALYRGPTVIKEYYKNSEATQEAFRDGWFHSGDLIKMDEEGFIYVVDRKKDMMISGGENIYPVEIEEVLYTHQDVVECAVIGVPDSYWGERVKAFIVKKPGSTLSGEEVMQYFSARLAPYKKPKEVEFIDELPKNAAGKVLKHELRKRHEVRGT